MRFKTPFLALLAVLCLLPLSAHAALSASELADCDGVNRTVAAIVPDEQAPVALLDDVQTWLTRFVSWGLNPKNVKISDFDFQFHALKYDDNWSGTNQLWLALKHKQTGKCQGGFQTIGWSHYPTAVRLTQLAVPEE